MVSTISRFLDNTYDMLCNRETEDIVSWSDTGTSILIKDTVRFAEEVLPSTFHHHNITSFIRQLNLYGFKKVKESSCVEYFHPLFTRDSHELIKNIKKTTSSKKHKVPFKKFLKKLFSIHKKQKKAERTLHTLEDNVKTLCHQNYLLIEDAVESNKKIGWYEATVNSIVSFTRGQTNAFDEESMTNFKKAMVEDD